MKSAVEKNLIQLIDTFEQAGVKLTESQKADIARYVRGLEQTDSAKDAKYRSIFETIQHNLKVQSDLASKVQEAKFAATERRYQKMIESLKTAFNENRRLLIKTERERARKQVNEAVATERQKAAEAVDKYLDTYLESVIPEQKLVDYKRLHELEAIVESMKDAIAFTNEDVEKRVSSIKRGYEDKLQKAQEVSAAKTKALNEAQEKINEEKARQYVIRRTKDLPALEAKMLRERFEGYKSIQQVRENFSKVLNEVEDALAGGGNAEVNTKLNNLDSKVNNVDSKINDLDSKIDQLVDTSMGGGEDENAEADVASGDAGVDMGDDLGSETSDGSVDTGMDGAPDAGASAAGGGAAPDFNAMSDDEINAHEFGTDDGAATPEGEQGGEEVAQEEPAPAQPAPQQAAPAQPSPQQQPVTEDFTIDSSLMNRFIAECIHITP